MKKQDVVSYMVNRQWTVDQKAERKRYLYRLAQQSKFDRDIASKIGGMLIYNQVIEQFLTDITKMSIYFIKAEVWPVVVDLDVDIDKATFGKVIEYFTRYSTVEPNREQLLTYLKRYKLFGLPHMIFDYGTGAYLISTFLLSSYHGQFKWYLSIIPAVVLLRVVQIGGYVPEEVNARTAAMGQDTE